MQFALLKLTRCRLGVVLTLLLLAGPCASAQDAPPAAPAKPTPNRADEPLAEKLSLTRTAGFLDGTALAWLNAKKCASCHTTYPYLLARRLLGDDAQVFIQMRDFLRQRVGKWDEGGKNAGLFEGTEGVTEVVSIAATLALHDAAHAGQLHPLTRKALERMWELQTKDGSWTWNRHRLPPQEYDDWYGAVYAALGVGHAPENYAQSEAAKPGLARLKAYFRANPPPNLHHKTLLLWASTKLDDLMNPADSALTVKQLLARQRQDGGWCLPSLADWKRLDGTPNDPDAASDGYATGLVLYVLRRAGVPKSDAAVRRGVKWLETHQRASGRWFTRSVNADRAHYNTVAGTAYAVMALKACDIDRPTAIHVGPSRNLNLKLALSPDGSMVAAIDFHGVIRVHDTANSKLLATLPGHQQWPGFVRFSADGKLLAAPVAGTAVAAAAPVAGTPAAAADHAGPRIRQWNTQTWHEEKTVAEHPWHARDRVAIDARFWDIALGRPVRGLNAGNEYQPTIIAASPDRKLLAVAEHFRQDEQPIPASVWAWEKEPDGKFWAQNVRPAEGLIEAIAWASDSRTVAIMWLDTVWKDAVPGQPRQFSRYQGKVFYWDVKGADQGGRTPKIGCVASYEGAARDVAFSPGGQTLFTCSSDQGAVCWDTRQVWKTGKLKQLARFPDRTPACSTGMALSADGSTLAVANTGNLIEVWDVREWLSR